jgi:hypothetical protein
MAFPARFATKCSKCNGQVNRGDLITWSRKQHGVVYHAACSATVPTATETVKAETVPTETTASAPTAPTGNNPLSVFVDAIAPMIQEKLNSKLDENAVQSLIDKAIDAARVPVRIEVKNTDTGAVKQIERPHQSIKTLLYFVGKRQHVYLYGPAGSGKSTAAHQVADALNLQFGYVSLNPQTPESRILGFIDAGGTYRETPFYRCYRDGGVFCIDEMDNASAALLTTLNSLLENGHGAFPNGIVPRHENFVLVATGNTNGRGANPMFPERRPFDVAFAERFTFMLWDYDTTLERDVTLAINPNAGAWLKWIGELRAYCGKHHPRVLVSPRASFKGAEYLKDSGLSPTEIAEAVIFKGLDRDTVANILRAVPYVENGGN